MCGSLFPSWPPSEQIMCDLEATLINKHKWDKFCFVDSEANTTDCSQSADSSIVQVTPRPSGLHSCSATCD